MENLSSVEQIKQMCETLSNMGCSSVIITVPQSIINEFDTYDWEFTVASEFITPSPRGVRRFGYAALEVTIVEEGYYKELDNLVKELPK